jgi:Putative Actinobacterial Holin-X, holin superfamily III
MNQPSGFRRVVRDIADLCELQLELLAVDGKVAARRSGAALALLVIAAIFGLSASVATVLALASLLYEQAEWTMSSSLLAAAGVAAVIGGLFTVLGTVILKKAKSALEETRGEFAENLRWIKAAVIAPESSPRAQVNESSFTTRNSVGFNRGPAMNGNRGESHY